MYRCLSFGLWHFLTLLWVGLHCKIVVFPDHTACTDPGNTVGGAGGGGGRSRPICNISVINLINFLKLKRGSNIFRGGGGVFKLYPGGGGEGVKV